MAAHLPGNGMVALAGGYDYNVHQIRLGQNLHARLRSPLESSTSNAQEAIARHICVRPASISCLACTTSELPEDGSQTNCSFSEIRSGPPGNSEAVGDAHGGPSLHSVSGNDVQLPQQQGSNLSNSGPPGASPQSVGTVVICGWLGSNKRYLKKYQDWWMQNRWEPVVFMMPMRGALTLGATAQDLVEALVMQLAEMKAAWRKPQSWRLLFHCFSNTGWYTFGAVMEGLLKHAATLLQHVVGSIVDSAPHPEPCAKVWASGFASALLPRRAPTSKIRQNVYAWMEAFFEQWLKGSPGVRLQQLAAVLHKYQTFPQLYIYSESDHVVPHTSVEAFMEGQSKLGRVVSGLRFQTSPHVDHFRKNTLAYTEGLRNFVADALVATDPSRPQCSVMSQLHPAICTPEAG